MLSFDQTVRGTLIRGVLPDAEDKVADFAQHMRFGASTICSRVPSASCWGPIWRGRCGWGWATR
jgi:hypothetical protein